MATSIHLNLSPRCSACEDYFLEGESVRLFLGYDTPVSSRTLTQAFPFPAPSTPKRLRGKFLCTRPACRHCITTPECAAIHRQCLVTFVRACKLPISQAVEHMRTFVFYRRPWPHAPDMQVAPYSLFNKSSLQKISAVSDLSLLPTLPPELFDIILGLSPHAWLWRFMTVVSLSLHISPSVGPPRVFALESIKSWKRGGEPVITSDEERSVIRITIHRDGIQEIERLQKRPAVFQDMSASEGYIMEEITTLSGVKAYLKEGRLRLHIPPSMPTLPIWDTASPPGLLDCRFHTTLHRQWNRMRTIHLSNISGITFFYSMNQIFGIYPHYSAESCALRMFRRFTERRQKYTVWVYLPISRSDRVVGLSTRVTDGGLCIIVRTRQMGDIILGPQNIHAKHERNLIQHDPAVLIISEYPGDVPIILGSYRLDWLTAKDPQRSEFPQPIERRLGLTTYFSSAPLADILCAYVFEDDENRLCRGILLEYISGGLRAVGQCRIGVDLRLQYVRPSSICLRTVSVNNDMGRTFDGIQVAFGGYSASCHPPELWNCRCLSDTSTLQFWFSEWRSEISII